MPLIRRLGARKTAAPLIRQDACILVTPACHPTLTLVRRHSPLQVTRGTPPVLAFCGTVFEESCETSRRLGLGVGRHKLSSASLNDVRRLCRRRRRGHSHRGSTTLANSIAVVTSRTPIFRGGVPIVSRRPPHPRHPHNTSHLSPPPRGPLFLNVGRILDGINTSRP